MFATDIITAIRLRELPPPIPTERPLPVATLPITLPVRDFLESLSQSGDCLGGVHYFPEWGITIFGKGSGIGDKACQLLEKTSLIRWAGFKIPPHIILTHDLLTSGWPQILSQVVPLIVAHLNAGPLMIRSSAQGDARGIGIYESCVVACEPHALIEGIRSVLESYHSKRAQAYREKQKLPEGPNGLIIEPLVGQRVIIGHKYNNKGERHDLEGFAPILSGHGYTSVGGKEGYQVIVPGFGCAVDTRFGERITRSSLNRFDGIGYYLENKRKEIFSGGLPWQTSGLLRMSIDTGEDYQARVWDPACQEITRATDSSPLHDPYKANLKPFFDQLDRLERRLGKPQYVEWVMTQDKAQKKEGEASFWIVQIAEVGPQQPDFHFLVPPGEVVLEGIAPIGNGQKNCDWMYYFFDDSKRHELAQFNQDHPEGYLLIYPAQLTYFVSTGREPFFRFEDISNATAILEYPDRQHTSDPYGHWRGLLENTGIFFGILPMMPGREFLPDSIVRDRKGIFQKEGSFKIFSSEVEQRIVVYRV